MFDLSISFIREASHIYFTNIIYYHQLLTLYTFYSSIHISFLGSKITADGDCSHEIKKTLAPWKKSYDQPRQHFKKQRHYLANKSLSSQSYGFPSSHVCILELEYKENWKWNPLTCVDSWWPHGLYRPWKESWVSKNWCSWNVVLENTLESPLDSIEIQPVHPKGNQFWIFIGRTDAEAPILWPPDEKYWLIWKDTDAGKDWRQEEKGTTEDKMVGWHYRINGHEFE